jgi:DNA sulfur modification protein DndD
MAGQVVLLVHEGEIDKETGLEPLANRVGAVYEIERVSSSHSTIRRES